VTFNLVSAVTRYALNKKGGIQNVQLDC